MASHGAKANQAPITPLKLPRGVKTLVVYGGSFDPPHFYHTVGPLSVVATLYEMGEAWVLYVPAAKSPLKPSGPVADDAHRLSMLQLGLDLPGPRSIWTDELDRARWLRARGDATPSYTIDTLTRLRKIIPSRVELRILIGADQVAHFHRWKDYRRILRLATPLVMLREPVETLSSMLRSLDEHAWTRADKRFWCSCVAPNVQLSVSSTQVREAVATAPTRAKAWEQHDVLSHVTTDVARYIIKNRLYGIGGAKHAKLFDPKSAPRELRGNPPGRARTIERSATQALHKMLDLK